MIAYVRTGKWDKGSGGFGRSNLGSEVMVMDIHGRRLTEKPLAETFLAGWTPDGKHLICYRDYEYLLVSLDGRKSREALFSYVPDRSERATYLPGSDEMVFVQHLYQPPRGVIRTVVKEVARNEEAQIGRMLVPSPDGRYIAAIDVTRWADDLLWVYDTQNKSWSNLGRMTIHPYSDWDWMKATWNPWFADSSHLAFISGSAVVISTPDGKKKQSIIDPGGNIGLATPSPDGKLIAYVTFDATLNKEQPHWTFWGNTTLWVVPTTPKAQARAVTKKAPETTYCVRWINANEIVFDRLPHEPFGNNSRLWKVRVK
jgi:Tol biopolymer transport system component